MPEEYVNADGKNTWEIAELLREKYYELLGKKPDVPWREMDSDLRGRWSAAVEVLFIKCERQVQMDAKTATASFLDSIHGEGTFRKLSRPIQLLWEAILRHAINLITAGRPIPGERSHPDELQREYQEALEFDWDGWLKEKLRLEQASSQK